MVDQFPLMPENQRDLLIKTVMIATPVPLSCCLRFMMFFAKVIMIDMISMYRWSNKALVFTGG